MIRELIKRGATLSPTPPSPPTQPTRPKHIPRAFSGLIDDTVENATDLRYYRKTVGGAHPLSFNGVKGMGAAALRGLDKIFNHPLAHTYTAFGQMTAPKATGLAALSKQGSKETHMATLKDVLVAKIAKAKFKAKVKAPTGEVPAKDNAPTGEDGTKIAAADVKFLGSLIQGMTKQANVPGVANAADFLGDVYSKLPKFVGGIGTNIMPMLQAGSLLGTGLMGASMVYDKINNWHKSKQSYRQMFNELPQLQEYPRTQVDKYWTVLQDFAPALTTNPLVAGQFIQNMLNQGGQGVDHLTAGQLIGIQAQQSNAVNDSGRMKLLGDMASNSFNTTASPGQEQMLTGNYGNVVSQTGFDGSRPWTEPLAQPQDPSGMLQRLMSLVNNGQQ